MRLDRDGFRVFDLAAIHDPFELLAVRFEDAGKGRQGAVLVQPDERGVPLVRTTARFGHAAQSSGPEHRQLARHIEHLAAIGLAFNNALIETYTSLYTKMASHSDHALDLAEGSHIAVYSCYPRADADPARKLVVESKLGGTAFEIPLVHNTVVVFSVETNRQFRHKIVPAGPAPWLGVTFRTSKTYVQFRDGQPHFLDGSRLPSLPT